MKYLFGLKYNFIVHGFVDIIKWGGGNGGGARCWVLGVGWWSRSVINGGGEGGLGLGLGVVKRGGGGGGW